MAKRKDNFKVGQRVTCYRTHDKSTELTGTIEEICSGDEDQVIVKVDAGNGSMARNEQCGAADVTPIAEVPKPADDDQGAGTTAIKVQ